MATEEQLDDLLAQPSDADIAAMRELEGDLILLGAGGKMGPTLAVRARRALDGAGRRDRVIAASRYSSLAARELLEKSGVETIAADLIEPAEVARLPEAPNVIYMAGRKFGSAGNASLTWAMNAYLPAVVCEKFRGSRIVAFSSGNIYPFVPVASGGASESTPLAPVGEYAQSVLARERMFEYFSLRNGTPVLLLRLNYAVEMRYGVLLDIGTKVFERRPIDLSTGMVNVIWQGDANSVALRALGLCQSPPVVLNLTGPESLSVRYAASRFGQIFGIDPVFEGQEAPTALLNNAARCHRLLGYPRVTAEQVIEWTAQWIAMGGPTLAKPTHFEVRDGKF
ncbi:MAG: NAD(P)-dependent oxidoreductase [Acidobacteria bacterium]|nr:NAD(P)-dependent oxidoreductase [Acidobacteriota bacterium]MBI3281322.1 NAD(P)-dependent oxidoreductase [Acidobacteriota bacterium]